MLNSFKNIIRKRRIFIGIFFLLSLIIFNFLFPPPKIKEYSQTIYSDNGILLNAFLTKDDKWRLKSSIDEISPQLIISIIEKEDTWFYWHFGFNPFSIARALYQNVTSGKRVSGASTITMQLARLLEPDSRTYLVKFREIIRAVQIELRYSKKEILEMYLSLLPFGGNIEGVKSASYLYFNKPPEKLSLAQSVALTVIPNNPNFLRPDKQTENLNSIKNRWLNNFKQNNIFSDEEIEDAINENIESSRYEMPNLVPHFSLVVKNKFDNERINSSINLKTQISAEQLLSNYVERVKSKGVSNGAVLVIENKTMQIKAYCGSKDFFDNSTSGQVNGITAIRSPGSTLKPFLFAKAFNDGLLTPKMKLLDIPTDFGGYQPENFDTKFNGWVTAEFALSNSLNIPSVRLLKEIGVSNFINLLEQNGFKSISENKNNLGLSLILGGCGVTLEELTSFYTCLANEGKMFSLNYLNKSLEETGIPVFNKGAGFLIAEILSRIERPDLAIEFINQSKLPKIAWKTGTSYGKRDAWAIGFNPNYTIGVWMGNFDGKGSPYLSGAEMAVPLLFDLFNTIDYNSSKKWFDIPDNIIQREVCSETGMLPSANCKSLIYDYAIDEISSKEKCNLQKEIFVSDDEKIEYCSDCLPNTEYKKKLYPIYDPELSHWFELHNIYYEKIPSHNINCTRKFKEGNPIILSPSADYEYFLETYNPQKVMLQAASEPSVKFHFWYIDNRFYKKAASGEKIFFEPKKGINEITCTDDKGRTSKVNISVKFY